jgi:hypothetical protein
VYHQRNQVGQDTDDGRQSDPQDREHHGIGRRIRLEIAVPDTVLVAHLCDGALLLHGWRDGPSADLGPFDAIPRRCELAAPCGAAQPARGSSAGDAR